MRFGITNAQLIGGGSWNAGLRGRLGDQDVFLKVINEENNIRAKTDSEQFAIASLVRLLHRQGLALTGPIEGISWIRVDGYWLFVCPWVGDAKELTLPESGAQPNSVLHRAATALARFHALAAGECSAGLPTFAAAPFALPPSEWSRWSRRLWSRARVECSRRQDNPEAIATLGAAESFGDAFVATNHRFFADAADEKCTTHGDFRPGNLVSESGTILVVDFDLISRNRLAVDVAYAALTHAGAQWLGGPVEWRAYDLFVETYQRECGRRFAFDEMRLAAIYCGLRGLSVVFKPSQVGPRWQLLTDMVRRYHEA